MPLFFPKTFRIFLYLPDFVYQQHSQVAGGGFNEDGKSEGWLGGSALLRPPRVGMLRRGRGSTCPRALIAGSPAAGPRCAALRTAWKTTLFHLLPVHICSVSPDDSFFPSLCELQLVLTLVEGVCFQPHEILVFEITHET